MTSPPHLTEQEHRMLTATSTDNLNDEHTSKLGFGKVGERLVFGVRSANKVVQIYVQRDLEEVRSDHEAVELLSGWVKDKKVQKASSTGDRCDKVLDDVKLDSLTYAWYKSNDDEDEEDGDDEASDQRCQNCILLDDKPGGIGKDRAMICVSPGGLVDRPNGVVGSGPVFVAIAKCIPCKIRGLHCSHVVKVGRAVRPLKMTRAQQTAMLDGLESALEMLRPWETVRRGSSIIQTVQNVRDVIEGLSP